MVGLVLVSHSHAVALGAAELARQIGGDDVPIEIAGGMDLPGHPIGTDAALVARAIDRAWSDGGVLVLMDLGSAVLSAEMALDLLEDGRRDRVMLTSAPLVEGAVAAAVTAKLGEPLERVAAEARGGLQGKQSHLDEEPPRESADAPVAEGEARTVGLTVENPHGLHARPAARLVQTVSAFDAAVRVWNRTAGRGPADGRSLNAVATLGVTAGDRIEIEATGADADNAIAAILELASRSFDDVEDPDAAPGSTGPRQTAAEEPARGHKPAAGSVVRAFPASPGVGIGPARHIKLPELIVPEVPADDPGTELALLDAAIEATREDVDAQRAAVAGAGAQPQAAIFDAHLLFLQDGSLLDPARSAIARGRSAASAWHDAVESVAAVWDALEDPYLRARVEDLRSVGVQVLAHLLGVALPASATAGPGILIADVLTPADTAGLGAAGTVGVVTASGGPTSHAAVLARSLGIPAVVGAGPDVLAIPEGTQLAVDGEAGTVYVEPSAAELDGLRAGAAQREERERRAGSRAREPAVTTDGDRIEVAANIGSAADAEAAVSAGADGVGLFRTELLFMGRPDLPGEDEQEHAYRQAAEALDGRPMVVRTLDVGADKPVPSLSQPAEANPFLGVRGLRLALERPGVLETQLRAILRVSADHPVRIMFPMVSTLAELRAASDAVERARANLGTVGRSGRTEIGIMVEVPAAALMADVLAEDADFFSIGTNDLTQYALAADRGNERVAGLADALHPAVLRLIAMTAEAAQSRGRWVGVCGELAADPVATVLLLGLGVRELSMSAPAIAGVKEAVRSTDLGRARALAAEALGLSSAAAVRALLGRH